MLWEQGNGSLSAGLSSKRAINDAYTPWPHHDRGTARHKASSSSARCSVVKKLLLDVYNHSDIYSSYFFSLFSFFSLFLLIFFELASRETGARENKEKICSARKRSVYRFLARILHRWSSVDSLADSVIGSRRYRPHGVASDRIQTNFHPILSIATPNSPGTFAEEIEGYQYFLGFLLNRKFLDEQEGIIVMKTHKKRNRIIFNFGLRLVIYFSKD